MNPMLDRRTALSALSVSAAAFATASTFAQPGAVPVPHDPKIMEPKSRTPSDLDASVGFDAATGMYVLPPLPYDKAALEPHIDAQTMEIHHGKHHKAYVDGLNTALAELKKIRDGQASPSLIKHWSREVAFHASGHINHTLFWRMMAPPGSGPNKGGGKPTGSLADAIDREFESYEKFLGQFKVAATQVEGGGWAWLAVESIGKRLVILTVEKQQDQFIPGALPILGVDVWEHAYYLKYQNRRADYINAFLNVVNWTYANELYDLALK